MMGVLTPPSWKTSTCATLPSPALTLSLIHISPAGPALKVVMARTEHHRGDMTAVDVGLVLVAVGTPTGAAALINRGIRSLDDVENEI